MKQKKMSKNYHLHPHNIWEDISSMKLQAAIKRNTFRNSSFKLKMRAIIKYLLEEKLRRTKNACS